MADGDDSAALIDINAAWHKGPAAEGGTDATQSGGLHRVEGGNDRLPGPPPGHRIGTLARVDADGRFWVEYEGNEAGPLRAPSTVAFSRDHAELALRTQAPLLLAFLGECATRPVIVGRLHDAVSDAAPAHSADEPSLDIADGPPPSEDALARAQDAPTPLSASVDGRRVTLEAADEVVIRCGEASITLRRNGRLSVRGVYVETRARGVNRIKGGSVQIN